MKNSIINSLAICIIASWATAFQLIFYGIGHICFHSNISSIDDNEFVTIINCFAITGISIGIFVNLFNKYAIDSNGESFPIYIKTLMSTILFISLGIILPILIGIQNIIFINWPLNINGDITFLSIPFWFLISPILFYANDTMCITIRLLSNTKKPPNLLDYYKDLFCINRDVFSSFPNKKNRYEPFVVKKGKGKY